VRTGKEAGDLSAPEFGGSPLLQQGELDFSPAEKRFLSEGFSACVRTVNLHSVPANVHCLAHISLVFREMWDTTDLNLLLSKNESKAEGVERLKS
jgi:hypothetical protein